MVETVRHSPIAHRVVGRPAVTIAPAPAATRLSLRMPASSRAALAKALGVAFYDIAGASYSNGERAALNLGPDEWLVIDGNCADLAAACRGVVAPHSAVDISHRNAGIQLSGIGAGAVINAACPRDLSDAAFPVGRAARTILGKAEIVLWRTAHQSFRIECWRSFSTYVFDLLEEAARDPSL